MESEKYIFSNCQILTSNEFSRILTFLTGNIMSPSQALSHMKKFSSIKKNRISYTISSEEAWKHFSMFYKDTLTLRGITSYDRLAYETQKYCAKYNI